MMLSRELTSTGQEQFFEGKPLVADSTSIRVQIQRGQGEQSLSGRYILAGMYR